ncbi:hypothetical protein DPMN_040293 [Dreissena polymorpha]|uniref:Uncharacterized protein n=1 Tax=Dreissena polymorpha TaxID=45954 RepID=A0A9D4HWQ8_DREPO|nr:hypothetical protein DPMN_040293 [Dreissena polymorpha]
MFETGNICRHSSLYSRHSMVSQRLEAFVGTAACTVVTLWKIRDWKHYRHSSLYSRHSMVSQRLEPL